MALDAVGLQQPLRYDVDIKSGLVRTPMTSQLMKGDRHANRVIVAIKDGKENVDLSGVTVTGSFIRPPDDAEIPLVGSVNGNEAIVVLEDVCYVQEGYCEISVMLTVGSTSRTILTLTGHVLSKGSGAVIDVGGVIPNINDIIAQYAEMKRVTQETQAAGAAAGNAAGAANTAAGEASRQAQAAQAAAGAANTAAAKIDGMTVSAEKADAAGATISQKDGAYHVNFKLPKGDTGATPNITFEVATGAAGSDVQLEQSGTAEAPHIKLTIPRGDTGAVEGVDYYEGNPKALGTASPGTANGVARGDHVHPKPTPGDIGAASIDDTAPNSKKVYSSQKTQYELNQLSTKMGNYLLKDGTAADSKLLDGKDSVYFLRPHNLLDNSDFTNIVNQRGVDSGSVSLSSTYFIDRWMTYQGLAKNMTYSFLNSGLQLASVASVGGNYGVTQKLPAALDTGKTYTLAAMIDGVVYAGSFTPSTAAGAGNITVFSSSGIALVFMPNYSGFNAVNIRFDTSKASHTIKWAALYEGSYTADNLPPYVPKGYANELLECRRYYLPPQEYTLLCYADGYLFGEKFAFPMRPGKNPTPVDTKTYTAGWGEIANSNIIVNNSNIESVENRDCVRGETYRIYTAFTSDL